MCTSDSKPKLFLRIGTDFLESDSINVPLNFVNNCVLIWICARLEAAKMGAVRL